MPLLFCCAILVSYTKSNLIWFTFTCNQFYVFAGTESFICVVRLNVSLYFATYSTYALGVLERYKTDSQATSFVLQSPVTFYLLSLKALLEPVLIADTDLLHAYEYAYAFAIVLKNYLQFHYVFSRILPINLDLMLRTMSLQTTKIVKKFEMVDWSRAAIP